MAETIGLVRQWNLLAGLSSRPQGATVDELVRQHGASIKTIRRDLKTLRTAGFPLEETRGDHGRHTWRLAPDRALVPMSFNWEEAISLCLARRFLEPLAGTQFWTAASRAFRKVQGVLDQNQLQYLNRMAKAFHLTSRGTADKYAAKAALCDQLTGAIEEHVMVDLTYQSEKATEPASRTVYPLGWVVHKNALYLVAHAPDHDERRLYKLDRVESALITKLQFQPPVDFSLDDFLTGAFGVYRGNGKAEITVRVRFLPNVARAVKEKQYHASQRLTPERSGSVLAEYKLGAVQEIKSWLLSWGANAVVLEPPSLVEEMRAEVEALRVVYGPQVRGSVKSESRPGPGTGAEADAAGESENTTDAEGEAPPKPSKRRRPR